MPWIEETTSGQDIQFDSDGFLSCTRVFKVWGGPAPLVVAKTPQDIQRDPMATPPDQTALPPHGHILDTAVRVPGVNNDTNTGVPTKLTLHAYTIQPISAVIFNAVAHYSNDPKLSPLGSHYQSSGAFSLVPIPYVRIVTVVAQGSTPGGIGYVESALNLPMSVNQISQTVTLPRNQRRFVEAYQSQKAGRVLHNLPQHGWCRFDAAAISLRGPQYIDVTYSWTWESGIDELDVSKMVADESVGNPTDAAATLAAQLFPRGSKPADPILGTVRRLLPPYHTIEMVFPITGANVKFPSWIYRLTTYPDTGGYAALQGQDRFEWSIAP